MRRRDRGNRMETQILTAIATAFPFSLRAVKRVHDHLHSYDAVIQAVQMAQVNNVSLDAAVDALQIMKAKRSQEAKEARSEKHQELEGS